MKTFSVFVISFVFFAAWNLNIISSLTESTSGYYKELWEINLNLFGYNRFLLFTLGTMASLGISFWVTNAFFIYLDLYGKPKFLHKFKIQQDKNIPVDKHMFKKCIHVINVNQAISAAMILLTYPMTSYFGMTYKTDDLPTLQRFALEFAVLVIVQEFGFYYFHRLMHHPVFYKRFHKLHHEWVAPISIAVVYAHPVEHILVNMLPILFSPILLGCHLSTSWIWFAVATFVSSIHHSGYHLPGFPSPEFHDFHHFRFTQCFGTIGLLDWLHATDIEYRKTKKFSFDQVYFALKPIWNT